MIVEDTLILDERRVLNMQEAIKSYKEQPKEFNMLGLTLTDGWVKAFEALTSDWKKMHEWLSEDK